MVRLTCLLRRKAGLSPAEFHAHWREVHGPLIAASRSGSHVVRYEQHPRALEDYAGDDDPGFDGVTVQWFESLDAYRAHMAEPDFPDIWIDIESFLDTDRLHFILTEHPRVVMGDDAGSLPLA
ncbi:MAG TPA: EthD domain-containing protein [Solirubrobacteraceae bacterium]|nr:EthD domain-containing protein [Solirubrobacteraceae bacterium]